MGPPPGIDDVRFLDPKKSVERISEPIDASQPEIEVEIVQIQPIARTSWNGTTILDPPPQIGWYCKNLVFHYFTLAPESLHFLHQPAGDPHLSIRRPQARLRHSGPRLEQNQNIANFQALLRTSRIIVVGPHE